MIVNNEEKIEPLLAKMKQWSILSNPLNYIQYHGHPKKYHNLGISTVNKNKNNSDVEEERDMAELDFSPTLNILKEQYVDIHK